MSSFVYDYLWQVPCSTSVHLRFCLLHLQTLSQVSLWMCLLPRYSFGSGFWFAIVLRPTVYNQKQPSRPTKSNLPTEKNSDKDRESILDYVISVSMRASTSFIHNSSQSQSFSSCVWAWLLLIISIIQDATMCGRRSMQALITVSHLKYWLTSKSFWMVSLLLRKSLHQHCKLTSSFTMKAYL